MLVATIGLMVATSIATALWPFHALALVLALPAGGTAAATRSLTRVARRVASVSGADAARGCASLWVAEPATVALVPSQPWHHGNPCGGPRVFDLVMRRRRRVWSAAGAGVARILAALRRGASTLLCELAAGRPGPTKAAGLQHWSVSPATQPQPRVETRRQPPSG